MIQTYQTLDGTSTARACLDLINRHCPRLMREGGGNLSREEKNPRAKPRRLSGTQKEQILAKARNGEMSQTQIANLVGATCSAVNHFLNRNGIKLPDGRKHLDPRGQLTAWYRRNSF